MENLLKNPLIFFRFYFQDLLDKSRAALSLQLFFPTHKASFLNTIPTLMNLSLADNYRC